MGRKSNGRKLKCAWIDEGRRIVSFTHLPGANNILAEEALFWEKIALLMQSGYRIQ